MNGRGRREGREGRKLNWRGQKLRHPSELGDINKAEQHGAERRRVGFEFGDESWRPRRRRRRRRRLGSHHPD